MTASAPKFKSFSFLVYPENAKKNWVETLASTVRQFAISPLHEPDEEVAKPHYHVIYQHPGNVTMESFLNVIPDEVKEIAANGYFIPVDRNYQRYLCHLDQPEKQQFDGNPYELIEVLNGFPLDLHKELTASEKRELRKRVYAFTREYEFVEYADLLDALADKNMWDEFEFAFNHTIALNGYLKSNKGRYSS